MILTIIGISFGLIVAIVILCMFAWYRVVPPSEAHLVVTPNKRMVCSGDPKIRKEDGSSQYFAIPGIPFIGRQIRIMDITTQELIGEMETYEKNQARYSVRYSLKYRIEDVRVAAETFISQDELKKQLDELTRASVRAVTVKYDVVEARANKQKMSSEIEKEIIDDLARWGLSLVNFVLVDFADTEDSHIISDISKRREVEIESETRQENAEKFKKARVKEAESEEIAMKREILKDQEILKAAEDKKRFISIQEKNAKTAQYEVLQVEVVRKAEIEKNRAAVKAEQDKEVAIIRANQDKDAEKIMMEQKRLEGEGDRKRAEEQAKGQAAPIRETGNAEAEIIKSKGLAEAEAKDKLQAALNKFGTAAIQALVAEQIVSKDEAVGVATARALEKADLKVFSGDGNKQGFDLAQLVASSRVADESSADALLNKIARPNDLGLNSLGDKLRSTKGN